MGSTMGPFVIVVFVEVLLTVGAVAVAVIMILLDVIVMP